MQNIRKYIGSSGFIQAATSELSYRQDYFTKLKKAIDDSWFLVVENIEEDGLYVGKRAIRGAQGQGDLLNQAGTVFYHTVLYVRANGKVGWIVMDNPIPHE